MVVVKVWSQVGSQRTQVVVVGVSIEAVVQLKEGFARVDQLSSLPVKAFPFQVMAFQALALWWLAAWIVVVVLVLVVLVAVLVAVGVVELGQEQEMKQCFPRNQMMRSHCWSQFLFWVHLQC